MRPRTLQYYGRTSAVPFDLVLFLIRRMKAWQVKLDEPATLRLLMLKSGGVVGYALGPIIKAIDNGRVLTRDLVERSDPDPNSR